MADASSTWGRVQLRDVYYFLRSLVFYFHHNIPDDGRECCDKLVKLVNRLDAYTQEEAPNMRPEVQEERLRQIGRAMMEDNEYGQEIGLYMTVRNDLERANEGGGGGGGSGNGVQVQGGAAMAEYDPALDDMFGGVQRKRSSSVQKLWESKVLNAHDVDTIRRGW
jgi:hypothetical protein